MSEHDKLFTIIVGQDDHKWARQEISYSDVVAFYLQDGGSNSNEYLIKYSQGPKENPSGTLPPAGHVTVKNGMHFRVSGTGES
jgi:hypothetical protein